MYPALARGAIAGFEDYVVFGLLDNDPGAVGQIFRRRFSRVRILERRLYGSDGNRFELFARLKLSNRFH